jgi:hypothetical protein
LQLNAAFKFIRNLIAEAEDVPNAKYCSRQQTERAAQLA